MKFNWLLDVAAGKNSPDGYARDINPSLIIIFVFVLLIGIFIIIARIFNKIKENKNDENEKDDKE